MRILILILLLLSVTPSYSNDIECLAQNIYFEARGEPYKGQVAVALVTLNRVNSDKFPDSVCEVIFQDCQFSWTCDKKSNKFPRNSEAGKAAIKVATLALSGNLSDFTNGALYFSTPNHRNKFSGETLAIGNHVFYRGSAIHNP